jgi:hypothetical protein
MLKLKYRNYELVSNNWEYNMLWQRVEKFFTDMLWQKPNITVLAIN